jgi:hypothetical protein
MLKYNEANKSKEATEERHVDKANDLQRAQTYTEDARHE